MSTSDAPLTANALCRSGADCKSVVASKIASPVRTLRFRYRATDFVRMHPEVAHPAQAARSVPRGDKAKDAILTEMSIAKKRELRQRKAAGGGDARAKVNPKIAALPSFVVWS